MFATQKCGNPQDVMLLIGLYRSVVALLFFVFELCIATTGDPDVIAEWSGASFFNRGFFVSLALALPDSISPTDTTTTTTMMALSTLTTTTV